ncbi:hypothetical protein [Roseomonas gilardii]|nr:hypothetical protein [Roseomonas gilardii]
MMRRCHLPAGAAAAVLADAGLAAGTTESTRIIEDRGTTAN